MTTTAPRAATYARGELLAAVRELRPLIESNRRWAHENARMAPPVLDACREAGVFTMVSPRELGGADVELPELYAILEELGYSDPTIAWHTGNSFAIAQNIVYIDEAERQQLFAGPQGPFGFSGIFGGIGRPVDGGYRVSGRWQFLTGSLDAPWAWLHGTVYEGDAPRKLGEMPDQRAFIVPARDLVIERTWDAAIAMRGTGSHAVCLEDVFVPEGLAYCIVAPLRRQLKSNASRWPRFAGSPVSNAANALGIARRMVDEAIALAAANKPRMEYTPYAERRDVQRAIAAAKATVAAQSAAFAALGREIQDTVDAGQKVTVQLRARMWATFWGVMDAARSVGNEMAILGTSKLYSQPNLMDLCLRDLQAIVAASEAQREYQEAAGRVLMGMPPDLHGF